MNVQLVHHDGLHTYVAVLDKGDEVVSSLTEFAAAEHIEAASLSAIGAFSRATIGYFDRQTKAYERIPIDEQVEVLSLVGDVALADGAPHLHAHVVLGRRDGTTCGGHLLDGQVWPTLEVVITQVPGHLRRRTDPQTGLALIDLESSDPQTDA
jgi:predicted DNA-binding protein with PD1-like motif